MGLEYKMTTNNQAKQKLVFRILTLAGLACIVFAYFAPIWWVSLTAPQYPDSAFPQGIRIHFHMDGVFNGCQKVESEEKYEEEALNCKHEMDAINHYVGMYPIAAGGPVERTFSPFLMTLLVVMLLTFLADSKKARLSIFAVGCIGISAWMTAAIYSPGGVNLLSPNYIYDFSTTMDLDPVDYEEWSAITTIEESYSEALGRYFRVKDAIAIAVNKMITAAHVVYGLTLLGMAVLFFALWKIRLGYWLFVLVPAALPVFFIIEYASWLWWFGHSLSEYAAFTVKPFMPTVFGQGKVAQFSTFSYPHYGFALLMGAGVTLALAALIRRKQLREADEA